MLSDVQYSKYTRILHEELVPAMGCTEPIALAYAAAVARDVLGAVPERICVQVSGSILKNVKSVIVPNTNGLKGIAASVAAGTITGKAEKQLEVIASVAEDDINRMKAYMDSVPIEVQHLKSNREFELIYSAFAGDHRTDVHIVDKHTHIISVKKDGKPMRITVDDSVQTAELTDRSFMNVKDILEYAETVNLKEVSDVLERQIRYNSAISEEGMRNDYGANLGKTLLRAYGDSISNRARAVAAAGSDARMNGCEMPVVINSGSGNQGLTCSLPVIEYAKELQVSNEKLLRALVLSNLVTIHQKSGIGTLSAFCGAVCAGVGAGAGIAYLHGGGYAEVAHTIVNSIAVLSGMVCDGAKASCAAKIAMSVEAGILGYNMYMNGQEFYSGDGIVIGDVESIIKNVGLIGREGMRQTNEEIINLMVSDV